MNIFVKKPEKWSKSRVSLKSNIKVVKELEKNKFAKNIKKIYFIIQ